MTSIIFVSFETKEAREFLIHRAHQAAAVDNQAGLAVGVFKVISRIATNLSPDRQGVRVVEKS